jgi:hypothetical protein
MSLKRKNCALMGYNEASSGNLLPTFWDNLSVPSTEVKNPKTEFRSYHHTLRNSLEEHSYHLLRGKSLKSRGLIT